MSLFEGILLIDKPKSFTSFDVIAKLRGMTRTKRIGHAGTLDPLATGVLPIFFGRATKAVDLLPDHDKIYEATFQLGLVTDTQDITGEVISKTAHNVTAEQVKTTLQGFLGEQKQLPPMYSAVRVNGQRLYDIARNGGEVKRDERDITVYAIGIISENELDGIYKIRVSCSRGTYIRTICHDLGQTLGCGAVLTDLRRTDACGFSIKNCITLEEAQALTDADSLAARLLPTESAFAHLPTFILNETQTKHFCCGLELGLSQFSTQPVDGAKIAVYDETDRFLGLAAADCAADKLKIIKLFVLGANL